MLGEVRTGRGHPRALDKPGHTTKGKRKGKGKDEASVEASLEASMEAASVDTVAQKVPPRWAGTIGGVLLLHVLPWGQEGVLISLVRLAECPTPKWIEAMRLQCEEGDGMATSYPQTAPVADREIWAHGNGGHLHVSMLEQSIAGGSHPAVELERRIEKGLECLMFAYRHKYRLIDVCRVHGGPQLRVILPRQEEDSWPPPEHKVSLKEHQDSACLAATALFWTGGTLITCPQIVPGANFLSLAHHLPKERLYSYQASESACILACETS